MAQQSAAPDPKPTPQIKARQLLDSSLETLSSASPAIQVAALLEIIQLYPEFDKAKTLELLDQAFAAAGAVPPEASSNVTPASLQTRVVFAAADVDVDKAIEMLPGLPVDRRGNAVERIALALIAKKETDRAARVVEENSGQGYPPLRAIDSLLRTLPPDDPRRLSLFSNAFMNVQLDSGVSFQDLIAKHWRIPAAPCRRGRSDQTRQRHPRSEGRWPILDHLPRRLQRHRQLRKPKRLSALRPHPRPAGDRSQTRRRPA